MRIKETAPSTWIWYPGDYELWLGNGMNNRRTERGAFFPPFWRTDSHYVTVEFSKKVFIYAPEPIEIAAEGRYNVKVDGKLQSGQPKSIILSRGPHQLNVKVYNQVTPPALYIRSKSVGTDGSWKVTAEDKEWIDQSGKVSDTSTTVYMNAGYWNFNTPEQRPSTFKLAMQPMEAVETKAVNDGQLVDFGQETFGYIRLHGLHGEGAVRIHYGESPEEATDKEHCETLDRIYCSQGYVTDLFTDTTIVIDDEYTLAGSKAFRYIYIEVSGSIRLDRISMVYEYLPETCRGTFRCSDEDINRIWQVAAHTMQLTTREFFIDGIKRDRWVWSGDAIQSYLMNYYLFFDLEAVKRTIRLLRGKDPVTSHVNTIMDYTFFWFISIGDYYMYSGDKAFIIQIYPSMKTMMDYVLSRTNENNMVEGMAGDWVFIDWADEKMDKKGEVAYEQLLLCRSLEAMVRCGGIAGDSEGVTEYAVMAADLRCKLQPAFWDKDKQAFVHNRINGKKSNTVTRYANIFAILFGYTGTTNEQAIRNSVLLNDNIMKITTPYMRFYELDALCLMEEHHQVIHDIKEYWGGMLAFGATSFWEKFNPKDIGTEHLAMYGRPYGKSLCHAWGASPLYLLGKHFLGVRPVKEGYSEFIVSPNLGGLEWVEGTVPTPRGDIHVYMDDHRIEVQTRLNNGYIIFSSSTKPEANKGPIESLGGQRYRLKIRHDIARPQQDGSPAVQYSDSHSAIPSKGKEEGVIEDSAQYNDSHSPILSKGKGEGVVIRISYTAIRIIF